MLQRIQTVFLLLIVLLMGATLIFPIWSYTAAEGTEIHHVLFALYYEGVDASNNLVTIFFPYSLVATLAIGSITVTIIEISKFKNRLLQMKLGALNSLLMAGTLILAIYFVNNLMESKGVAGGYGVGLYLPGVAMICNVIANRFIRKDEKLVRSVDRIR